MIADRLMEVSLKGQKHKITLPDHLTDLDGLRDLLAVALNADARGLTIIFRGKRLGPELRDSLSSLGITGTSKLLLMPSPSPAEISEVEAVQDQRIRGFEEELHLVMRRRQTHAAASTLPSGPYTFQGFEVWERPGLSPAPAEARKLLHRLAADRGIIGIMAQHRWTVHLLSEMPPEGKVGVSPVCILGVNINAGQEISLRLRTDDLQGFRRYDRIRETLIHELTHMVWGDHDNNFKELNSQLLREVKEHDWTTSARAMVAETGSFEGTFTDPNDVMAATAQSSGAKLGGARRVNIDARSAAVAAARARSPQSAAADRVTAAGPPAEAGAAVEVEGMGHLDAFTEEKEEAARRLGAVGAP